MALDAEFKHHLHELMVEVADNTRGEETSYKNRHLARAVHPNSSAMPIVIKDAKLHALEIRIGQTIAKYIEAASIWGLTINDALEKDLIQEFWHLVAGPNQLQFPPMVKGPHVQAVQGSYARERAQLANRLVREGTNRLKELKVKNAQAKRTAAIATINNTFNAPVGNAYINSSVHQTSNSLAITGPTIDDILRLSAGNPELQSVALELRDAHAKGANTVEKIQKWLTLASSVSGLIQTIHQSYPHIEAFLSALK